MFDTPQEAALKAENARLRAENEWLRKAVEAPDVRVKPWGVEQELSLAKIDFQELRLPRAAGIRGKLMDDGRWNVLASADRLDGGQLRVEYFTPSAAQVNRKELDDNVFVNHILPKMHERFIGHLSDLFKGRS